MGNITNNLFNYATSELSQDAFICYLASFAMKGNNKNACLYKCAIDFINMMLPDNGKLKYGEYLDSQDKKNPIEKQHSNIDVLIHAKGYSIIIEDKTFSNMRENQINDYVEKLLGEGYDKSKIRTVYYKIIEHTEDIRVDCEFDRKKLLELFDKYYKESQDKIFTDYVDYLREIDNAVDGFKIVQISDWDWKQYIGFFNYIKEKNIITGVKDSIWWGYVPNQDGGFWGMCWTPQKMENLRINCNSELYLQIEGCRIVLKVWNLDLSEDDAVSEEKEKQILEQKYSFKDWLDGFMMEKFNEITRMKKIRITKRTASLYYVEYNENNYEDKIKLMNDLFDTIKDEYDRKLENNGVSNE